MGTDGRSLGHWGHVLEGDRGTQTLSSSSLCSDNEVSGFDLFSAGLCCLVTSLKATRLNNSRLKHESCELK